ncbi:PIG-L family deacetylase [Methylococcus geothermalis]|uniref:Glycosyltransferase n=1 Tax=Methylococcus geothermalis TaxID=2681310 RepID=A0A858QBL2_9GAMM|nr:PIG-L family deacetylase [Methylococcus geothermalis]QJD31203.1 glycosyltransferase [Methylococcus geothermalis]
MQSSEQDFLPYAAISFIGPGPAIVFAPHPDDEVFGCGGAIMRHISAGDSVRVIVVTDGAYGSAADFEEYALTRQRESILAAEILGYGVPEFWNLPDRGLEYGERLIQRILASIEACAAELVYAPSWWEIHPDHRVLALATAEAVRRSPRPIRLAMYEVGVPLQPNALLDITDLTERKAAAVACFSSQLAQQNYDKQIAALNRFRTYTLPRTIEAAEGYLVLAAEELRGGMPSLMTRKDRLAVRGENGPAPASPLVSVIIRSMDRAQLREALDSVALQTYPRIEVIVVNAKGDGHTPLAPWCGRFPLRFIPSNVPLSRSRTANIGLDRADGEYLIVLDDDHFFQPDHIACLVEALQGQSAVRCAYAGTRLELFSTEPQPGESVFHEPPQAEKPWKPDALPLHAILFHRSLLDLQCRFDENLNMLEDWDFLLQAMRHTAFIHVDKVGLRHRNHKSSGFEEKADGCPSEAVTATAFGNRENDRKEIDEADTLLARDMPLTQNVPSSNTVENGFNGHASTTNLSGSHPPGRDAELDRLRDRLSKCEAELANHQSLVEAKNADREVRNVELDRLRRSIHELLAAQLKTQGKLNPATTSANRSRLGCDAVHESPSWASSAPLRFGARLVRGRYGKAWDSLRHGIRPAGRTIYKTLPRHLADPLIRIIYRHFGPMFAGFDDYERWRRELGITPKETYEHHPRERRTTIDSVSIPDDQMQGRITAHGHFSYSGLAKEKAKYLFRLTSRWPCS